MATRARGRLLDSTVDQVWPYQVVVDVPGRGLGRRLDAMLAWLAEHAPRTGHTRRSTASLATTCYAFKSREVAEAFQAVFGGEMVEAQSRSRRRRASWPP